MRQPSKKKFRPEAYARYSALTFQMLGIILLGTWGGWKLDKLCGWKFPLLTLLLSLFAISLAIYLFVKDFLKK